MDDGISGRWTTLAGHPEDSLKTSFVVTSGIQVSRTYAIRYRVRNSIGWSKFSSITYITAAGSPSIPAKPELVSSTSTDNSGTITHTMIIEFGISKSNGGSEISSYMYQIDNEDGSGFSDQTTYSEGAQQITFEIASGNTLEPGSMYKLRSLVTNIAGHTTYSPELRIHAAIEPDQPSAPQRIVELSNTTTIAVNWEIVKNTYSFTSGYKLFRDGGNDGNFTLIYDGTNRPGQLMYLSNNLITGQYYRFKVLASNFNGEGNESDEVLLPACMPPTGLAAPALVSSTAIPNTLDDTLIEFIDIKLKWTAPDNVNGCGLTGWKLLQGATSDYPLVESVSDTIYSATSRTQTIRYPIADEGTAVIFQLVAINDAGSVKSNVIEVKIATVPEKPVAPISVASQTNSTHITLQLLSTDPDLNGGTLKHIQLQMYDSEEGTYIDINNPENTCLDKIITISKGIVAGKTYQFRYRIKNENGWSQYSEVTAISAAVAPSSPARPTLDSATDSQIDLLFSSPEFNGGSHLLTFELYINE